MKIIILTICMTLIFMLAGCSDPFLQGAVTGATATAVALNNAVSEANMTLDGLNANIAIANDAAGDLGDLSDDPMALVTTINPELGNSIATLLANLEALEDKAGEFDADKLGWAGLMLLLGGSGVNIYKNRKKTI